jgi:hypothetical protein
MLREQTVDNNSKGNPGPVTPADVEPSAKRRETISNQQLTETFLSPQMECYFRKKLPDVAATEVLRRIQEALKFLNMAIYCEGNIPVTQQIDDIWHLWILETKEYAKLCASLEGHEFLHHCSNTYAECDPEAVSTPANSLEQDVAMLGNYVLNYGPFEDDRVKYWLLADHLVSKCGMTTDQLNKWLMSGAAATTA